MPSFQLTRNWNGRPVVVAPEYSMGFRPGEVPFSGTPADILAWFVKQHEERGLKPVTIYVRDPNPVSREYWRAEFPGCTPGRCANAASDASFKRVSNEVAKRFQTILGGNPRRDVEVAAATIDGELFSTILDVRYDYKGRVIRYSVTGYKSATTRRERSWASRNASSKNKTPIPIFRYSRNMVLDVEYFKSEYNRKEPSDSALYQRGL